MAKFVILVVYVKQRFAAMVFSSGVLERAKYLFFSAFFAPWFLVNYFRISINFGTTSYKSPTIP